MLALGTAIGRPAAAVSMGVGAMLVGVAWRAGDGPDTPPLETMGAAAVMLVLSTVVGTVTGRWPGLHLAVLVLFCLLAGLATSLGRRGVVVGVQTLIAFVVFGRFPEPVLGALRLAGLVAAGAAAQLIFSGLVAAPLAWRRQRRAIAEAYRRLAEIAGGLASTGLPAAQAFDGAELALDAPALFADAQLDGLLSLAAQGRRIRLELLVLIGTSDPALESALGRLGALLGQVAEVLESGDGAAAGALAEAAAGLRHWSRERPGLASPALEERLAALGGQVRAAARLTVEVVAPGEGAAGRLMHPRAGHRVSRRLRSDLRRLRESASLHTVAGRHALRLAVVVAGTDLLAQRTGLPRGYWAVVAAATVLRPNFGDTFTRGAERMLGTLAGVVLATLIAVALNPVGWGIVAVVGLLAFGTYAVFPASFAAGTVGLTAMIVFLLHAVSPASVSLALDRGLDTVVGGVIGLGAYILWPTWSAGSLPRELRRLVAAQGEYLQVVLTGLRTGVPGPAPAMIAAARGVRIAYADADATLAVARGEPDRDVGLNPGAAAVALAALRRVTVAIHALRLSQEGAPAIATDLEPLAAGLAQALGIVAERVAAPGGTATVGPSLRDLYRRCAGGLPDPVGAALDELVDAVDSALAALAPAR